MRKTLINADLSYPSKNETRIARIARNQGRQSRDQDILNHGSHGYTDLEHEKTEENETKPEIF